MIYKITVLIVSPRLENKLTTSCWVGVDGFLFTTDFVRDSDMDLTIGGALFMLFE